jgi:predicted DNA-binding protein YlxM (UPF0122 family)
MKNLNRTIFILLLVLSGYGLWAFVQGPKIIYQPVTETEQIDENIWVRRSQLIDTRHIMDSLQVSNQALYDQLRATIQRLEGLVSVEATLKVYQDSVKQLRIPEVKSSVDIDTSLVNTYADSLFQVDSTVKIDSTGLLIENDMKQIRPIDFQIAMSQADDQVFFYVSSDDFEEINIKQSFAIKRKKDRRWHYAIAGVVTGILSWELIR